MRQNPVFLREKGMWGRANPYYGALYRYWPLAMMAALILGVCGATGNSALLISNEELALVWCLLCLPGMALSAMMLFGSLMAPALTAPAISYERETGAWEILCVTPLSQRQIVLAKLFGGLARLRIFWLLLFAASLFQGAIMACSLALVSPTFAVWSWLLGLSIMLRPWLEVSFAGLAGILSSLWVRSAVVALVTSYTAVLLFKLLNNSLLWLWIGSLFTEGRMMLMLSNMIPTTNYALALLVGILMLLWRSERLTL